MNKLRLINICRWMLVAFIMFGIVCPGLGAEKIRKRRVRQLGTCGPPPRKYFKRQASGEVMPPLPAPAVPLRVSEPKAEPKPSIVIAKLEYGETLDWATDPGDLDNLVRRCQAELGIWVGQTTIPIQKLVDINQADGRCGIPILYLTGHESFTFSEDERLALRQYILDGGMLWADACCGREEMAESIRKEVLAMFPARAFDWLELDHPIFRSYYEIVNQHFTVHASEGGVVSSEFTSPPQFLGVYIGCRAGIIMSPYDISCGLDGHTHTHGSHMDAPDAMRIGINIIAYASALRELGDVQSYTLEIQSKTDRPREHLFFAQLKHQGDWNPDPNSVYQMLRNVALESSLAVNFELVGVDAEEGQLAPYPMLYLTGHRDPKLSKDEIKALRNHLQAGGFLFINNCCGYSAYDQAIRKIVKELFPDQDLAPIALDHKLFRSFSPITEVYDRQTGRPRPIELEGISIKNRLVLVYSKNDMVTDMKQISDPYGNGYDAESCRQLCLNMIAYALQN